MLQGIFAFLFEDFATFIGCSKIQFNNEGENEKV